MLCEFSLPSSPEKKVRLKEATVSDAIDFPVSILTVRSRLRRYFSNGYRNVKPILTPGFGREKTGDSRSLPTSFIRPGIAVSR